MAFQTAPSREFLAFLDASDLDDERVQAQAREDRISDFCPARPLPTAAGQPSALPSADGPPPQPSDVLATGRPGALGINVGSED